MADLSTQYMGLSLKNPVVVGACSLSKHIDTVKEIEEAGAAALVIKSLFQEQIELEAAELESALSVGADSFAESLRFFPPLQHAGPAEHLMWVKEARKAVEIPLIASVNATSTGTWVDFAGQLEDTGVDGLELRSGSGVLVLVCDNQGVAVSNDEAGAEQHRAVVETTVDIGFGQTQRDRRTARRRSARHRQGVPAGSR